MSRTIVKKILMSALLTVFVLGSSGVFGDASIDVKADEVDDVSMVYGNRSEALRFIAKENRSVVHNNLMPSVFSEPENAVMPAAKVVSRESVTDRDEVRIANKIASELSQNDDLLIEKMPCVSGIEIDVSDSYIPPLDIPDTPYAMKDEEMTAASEPLEYNPELSENPKGKWKIGDCMLLPRLPSFVMFGTDYHFYNLPGTPHYRMREAAWTDEIGCRRYKDYYMVGLGSYYTVCIGDCFEIKLANGTVFNIILGDGKADCDTDNSNRYTPCDWFGKSCANVLEFIIDKEVMDSECYRYGGIHYYDKFHSDIVSMRYLGRDNSMDWDTYE